MAVGRWFCAPGVCLFLVLSGCSAGNRAAMELRAGSARDPQAAWKLIEEGLALVGQGVYAQAENKFRGAVQADPYNGAAHCNLGVSLLKQQRYYEAGWELQYACKLMPRAAAPHSNLALLFESAGNYGDAEQESRAALGNAPDDVEIVGQLARLHVRQGKRTAETLGWLQTIASKDDDPVWRNWARQELSRKGSQAPEIER